MLLIWWKFWENAKISTIFLKKVLAMGRTLCYNNSAFRMAADSLFVPKYEIWVSREEETARGTN